MRAQAFIYKLRFTFTWRRKSLLLGYTLYKSCNRPKIFGVYEARPRSSKVAPVDALEKHSPALQKKKKKKKKKIFKS